MEPTVLDFKIDWGYLYLYSRRHYHPQYIWDGELTCEGGEILESYQLEYPLAWYMPGYCPTETKLAAPRWESRTKRGYAGARFVAKVTADAVFTLKTVSGTFTFTAKQIMEEGRIEFGVGPKYQQCAVIVTKTGYFWFRPDCPENEIRFTDADLPLPHHNWARTPLAYLQPGKTVEMTVDVPASTADYTETLVHLCAMAVPEYKLPETHVRDYFPLTLHCDGAPILEFTYFFNHHDNALQILEDVWKRVRLPQGRHTIGLTNGHGKLCLGISRIGFTHKEFTHGQVSLPSWALVGETVHGAVFAAREDTITVTCAEESRSVACKVGWNEFPVCVKAPGMARFFTDAHSAEIEIIDCEEEAVPVKVGADLTQMPHDNTGTIDWLLEYIHRTRMGNYVIFRNFTIVEEPESYEVTNAGIGTYAVDPELSYRWGKYCGEHGIYAADCTDFMNGQIVKGAGEYFHDCGYHEFTGRVYGADPEPPYASQDMKEASEHFRKNLRDEINRVKTVSDCVAFGDASGGARYSFMEGAGFVRVETMVGPTMSLLSQARPAAESIGHCGWGVHIAIQHCKMPYRETHLGEYFLAMFQPWMMGAEVIYEEDCLFGMWSEDRMTWEDKLTKGKRDMTRNFFRFAKTHPRHGKNVRNIAFLEGRYAAPFSGFICGPEQDPHFSVWGQFGNPDPTWGHDQPEKCRQVLDVLQPGTSTHPFRQKFDKRRFYFAGTPYGDFDCIPVEAQQDYWNGYKLMLNLGWNTMLDEDYDKLKAYVEQGGVLLTGLPQFSTHVRRDFLKDMDDLQLYRSGDLADLCGFTVKGKGAAYSGQWNCADRDAMFIPELSALPSDHIMEDGEAFLAEIDLQGAEIVAWDGFTGKPMLVRHKVGKGTVYTFTLWAYPGHELYQSFCAAWTAKLAKDALPEIYIEDPTGEVFWTRWEEPDGSTTLMLLNTDWTSKGNEKFVILHTPGQSLPLTVTEREALLVNIKDGTITAEQISL